MAIVTNSRKIKRRRVEGVWTLVLSGVIGSCLAVVAVKQSLISTFVEHTNADEAAVRFGMKPPFCTTEFDFVLKPAR